MRKRRFRSQIISTIFIVFILANTGLTQNHDLVMDQATNITSSNPADWKSSDIKIGADFGVTFPPDIIRRGVTNPIYARFYFNGLMDHVVPSGSIQIQFHYRNATIGETPPALSDPSWQTIGNLSVDYGSSPPLIFFTKTWPDDFPGVSTKSIDWAAPPAGDYFHIRAEAVYPSGYTDGSPNNNIAISLYESILGIRDVDLIILIDVSGSMLYYQYAGSSYIDQVISRVIPFIAAMNEDHRLAIVAFGGCLTGDVADIWPTSIDSVEDATWANKLGAISAIVTNVNVPNTSCLTPMGMGLQRAIEILTAAAPNPTKKRTILLLTDGQENSGTPRACPPSYPTGTCVGGTILSQLQTNNIRVYSIALGSYAWTSCLECLANETDGGWYAPAGPGIELGEVYLDMQQSYSADDLYCVDHGISGGGDDTYETYFEGLDNLLYFILEWDALNNNLDFELRPPGNSWHNPNGLANATVQRGNGYVVVRVENPAQGNWGYRVIGEEGENYFVAVRSDQVGARLQVDVQSIGIVGKPIMIKAHLAERGQPIKNAHLTAIVQVPVRASLETKLRQASREHILKYKTMPVDPSLLKENPDISPRTALIQKMTNGKPETLVQTRSIKIRLKHDKDGYYSGILKDNTTISGNYRVTVQCSEKKFDRIQSRQIHLLPGKIDPRKSFSEILEIKSIKGESVWILRTYPTDQFGNAITSVSLVDQMKGTVENARLFRKPEIIYDGSFQQQLKVKPGQKPKLKMMKIGKEMKIINVHPKKIRLK